MSVKWNSLSSLNINAVYQMKYVSVTLACIRFDTRFIYLNILEIRKSNRITHINRQFQLPSRGMPLD